MGFLMVSSLQSTEHDCKKIPSERIARDFHRILFEVKIDEVVQLVYQVVVIIHLRRGEALPHVVN